MSSIHPHHVLTPPPLAPGARVALISTARRVDEADVRLMESAIRQAGYVPVRGAHLLAQHHQWAGTDAQRLSDLQWALDDADIAAVLCARGGYGTSRLLEAVDLSGIAQRPKWVVGYSDVTALLAALYRVGVASVHGPMGISWAPRFGLEAASLASVWQALAGAAPSLDVNVSKPTGLRAGVAEGPLVGGNLSLVVHLIGSRDALPLEGSLLVIEDLDEYSYHIDRMLLQLRRAGAFERIAGLVVGQFLDLKEKPESPFGGDVADMIAHHTAPYACPVALGLPIGHGAQNMAWVHGARARLSVTAERICLDYV